MNETAPLARLGAGVNCPQCHVGPDEACRTPRGAYATTLHQKRIDRAVRLFQKGQRAS